MLSTLVIKTKRYTYFSKSTHEYDVAILELTKPIALTSNTRAVCLPVDDTTGRPLTSFDISSNFKVSESLQSVEFSVFIF